MPPINRTLLILTLALFNLSVLGYFIHESHLSETEKAESSLFIWPQLMHTKIHTDYVSGIHTADIADDVKTMAGKPMTIGGFMVPLDVSSETSHFLLSRKSSTCPFCSSGEPNEIIEVFMEKPLGWSDDRIIISGLFELTNNTKAGIFYKLGNAKKLP